MRIAALLIAAGASRRFGGRKQAALIDGAPMARRAAQQLSEVFGPDLFAITGAYADEIEPLLSDLCGILRCPDWDEGMGASIAFGAAHLAELGVYDGALIAPADQPALTADDYRALRAAFDGAAPAAAFYAGAARAPAVFPARLFAALALLNGDRGAKSLLGADAALVPMDRAAIDIDTESEWRNFTAARR